MEVRSCLAETTDMEGQGAKEMGTLAIQASRYMGGNESLVGGWYTSTPPKNDGLRSSWDDFLQNSQLNGKMESQSKFHGW